METYVHNSMVKRKYRASGMSGERVLRVSRMHPTKYTLPIRRLGCNVVREHTAAVTLRR
jgi:hypothetical protein